jgi:hypothetical protein
MQKTAIKAMIRGAFLAVVLAVATHLPNQGQAQQMQDRKVYVFGNSLVHHLSSSDETTVPHWLNRIARADGNRLSLDGSWGFMRNFVNDLPPNPNWSFREVRSALNGRSFRSAGLDAVVITPANFVQYQAPDRPYEGDNPDGASPLDLAARLIDWTLGQSPGSRILVYEGWADMDSQIRRFPPNARALRGYHEGNLGAYHDWFVSYVRGLQAQFPGRDIAMIPVSSVLARLYTQTDLAPLEALELYEDGAPHGTANTYFLAALVTYAVLYDKAPPAAMDLPDSIHPTIRANYAQIADFIWTASQGAAQLRDRAEVAPAPVAPAPVAPAAAPDPAPTRTAAADPAPTAPVAPAVSVAASADPVADPVLAMGLNGVADWSTQYAFIDVMKTARPWIGHLRGQWGGFEIDRLQAEGYLDAQGWPLRIPREVDRLEAFILTDLPSDATSMAGRYVLTYEGDGKLEVAGRVSRVRYGPNRIAFDFTPGEGLVSITLKRTDPGGKGNHIRNIRVVREDHLELARLGEVFNPAWLAKVQDLRALRFMDWGFTNGSPQQGVGDRPLVDDFSYVWRGVPLEVMADLANLVGADPWFTVPHMADDALVRVMAEVVRDHLDPSLKAYVEYSNELWNFMFPQTHWAVQQANARWGQDAAPDAWMQFAGLRAAQVMGIWSDTFGDQAEARLVRVVATHTGWPGLEEGLLEAPLWRAEAAGNPAPVDSFDAYAVTGYFGHEMGTDDFAPQILDWLDEGEDVARREVTRALLAGSVKELLTELLPYQADLAARHGMRLVMYEGGTHVAGLGEWTENARLTDFFTSYNYSPEMGAIYTELLAGWDALGGTLFNAFVDVGHPTRWGSWGHLRHLGDSNPRWDALMAYNAAGGVTWEARAPGTFLNGVMRHAPEGGGRIAATHPRDILLGGPGDDLLVAMGCCVRMHGGAGVNTALLAGTPEAYDFLWMGDVMLVTARDGRAGEMRLADIQRITFADAPDMVMELTPPKPETEG